MPLSAGNKREQLIRGFICFVSKRALFTATNAVGNMQQAKEKASLNETASKEGAERVNARLELSCNFLSLFQVKLAAEAQP